MRFEDYVKEELSKIDDKVEKLDAKVEKLMIFMAVKKAEDSKNSKYISGFISLAVSVASAVLGKIFL